VIHKFLHLNGGRAYPASLCRLGAYCVCEVIATDAKASRYTLTSPLIRSNIGAPYETIATRRK
jgi:hypothetical protein